MSCIFGVEQSCDECRMCAVKKEQHVEESQEGNQRDFEMVKEESYAL